MQLIAASVQHNRAARIRHERLVERVAREMRSAGRIVWRGLSLRAPPLPGAESAAWTVALPDVYSIRHTTVEDYVEPIMHEVKVARADLLSDLRNAAKREAYRALSSQCWYVLRAGIGRPEEIPAESRPSGPALIRPSLVKLLRIQRVRSGCDRGRSGLPRH